MGKLIMIRHGESEGNRDRHFTISPEVPLTELGRLQAREVAAKIAHAFRPRLVISSPFRRARQTSEIIGTELKLPIEVVPDLHERDLGSLKGQSYDTLREAVRQDPAYDSRRGWLWKPVGGESYEDVRQRVVHAIEGLRTVYPDDELVVVSHGGVMLSMWAHVAGRWEGAHLPPNCGIVLIEHDHTGYRSPQIIEA
ncbi:MAG: histidine phosphatase family protein [Candidatus Binataceae bacterium]